LALETWNFKKVVKKEKEIKEVEGELEVKDVDQLLSSLQEKFGDGSIMKLGDIKKVNVDAIPTGSFSLDLALGVGGLPKGRIVEIFGPESSGKTTLALHVIAEAQDKKMRAAFIDAEHAMDPDYAKKLGVKVNDLIISQPSNGEEALNILDSLIRSGLIDVVVVDSVAALTPRAELAGEIGDQFMGLQARMMAQALRRLDKSASQFNTLVIFINQLREKIGIVFGNPETTPGGRALKFAASVRIDIRRIAQIKKGEEIVGNRVRAKVAKNKVAPPFREAEFDILYGEGISLPGDVLTAGIKYGSILKTGNTYSFEGMKLGVGLEQSREKLKEDIKLINDIKKKTVVAVNARIV